MQTKVERRDNESSPVDADKTISRDMQAGSAALDDLRPLALAQRQHCEIANAGSRMDQQRMAVGAIQRKTEDTAAASPNRTGLPDQLKAGIESLSGISMDSLKVHYNSSRPAELNAHAYAQGTDIHIGPGQERHLPHEASHVVQQAQGRVTETVQMAGVGMNEDSGLESEADTMGDMTHLQGGSMSAGTKQILFPHHPLQPQKNILDDCHGINRGAQVAQLSTATNAIDKGHAVLEMTVGYQDDVFQAVDFYTRKIRKLDDSGDANYIGVAEYMASGYNVWTENYYNKTQAYLYEAQKAGAHTSVDNEHSNQNSFAALGEDTDLEPDLTIAVERFGQREGGVPQSLGMVLTAVEMKASTSANYTSVDKLVAGGIKQLGKRENTGRFGSLRLEVHNDNPDNHWPITDGSFKSDFDDDFDGIARADFDLRLQARVKDMVATAKIKIPVEVIAEHDGEPYATARVN